MTKGYKRRKIFIRRSVQGRLILSAFFLISGGCLLFLAILFVLVSSPLISSFVSHKVVVSQAPLLGAIHALTDYWVIIVAGGIFLVVASILLSHRIAGPLYRFEKTLVSMNAGDLSQIIHLREKDEGQELAAQINLFNAKLSESMRAIQNNSIALETLIGSASNLEFPEGQKESIASLCWAMQEHNRKIKKSCSEYSL